MASSCKEGYYFCNTSQECKKIPKGHKVQSDGELVREYVSDWRSDLQEVTKEYIDKKQSQFKKEYGIQPNPLNIPSIQKANNEILAKHKLGGKSFEMTGDGQNINFGKWAGDKVNEIGKKATDRIDKVTNTATDTKYASRLKSHGTSADEIKKGADEVKSNIKKGGEEAEWKVRRAINKHTPGTPEHQTVGVEKDIALNTDKFKPKKKGLFQNKVVSKEELQGGVSIEPYTKDTKFLEIETVDIIKPKALNASDWRGDLEVVNEGNRVRKGSYTILGSGNKKDLSKGGNEAAPVDYRLIQAKGGKKKSSPKKNTGLGDFEPSGNIYAGYEPEGNNLAEAYLNEFNQLRDFVEELASEGYSAEEIYNHLTEDHELREAPVLKVLAEKVKLIQGAISGLKKIPSAIKTADRWGRNTWKFLKKVDSKARPIVKTGIENTKRALTGADQWGRKNLPPAVERGKKDLKKVSDFAQQAYSSLEKNVGQPLLTKGKEDIAKFNKTREVIRRANSLARTKAEKAGQIIDIAPKTTNLPQAKKSLPLTKNVTKDMSPKEIRSKGMNLLAKLQGKTPKQQKAKELTNRMSKAIDSSKKPTTYSGKVDAAKNLPDPGAIVKSSSSAVTAVKPAVKPSLDTTKGINMSLSSMASKVKNLLTGTKATKQITGTNKPKVFTGTKATKQITGTNKPKVFTGTNKKKSSKLIPTAIATGIVAGSTTTSQKKDKSVVASDPSTKSTKELPKINPIDPPNKNKTIVDTEKKKVDPKKNPVVDTYDTGRKDTKSKNLNPWGRSKQYKAKDGTVVDRSDVFTKAAFDFGPNIKKGEKIGVIGHGQRKKYDLEAARRKNVKEGAVLVQQLPKAFKAASKLKNVAKSNAIQKVFGGASALTGLSGMVRQSKTDALPDGDIPADIKKQMDADKSIDVPGIPMGHPDLEKHFGTKKNPKSEMKDKYDKDALDNAKTDSILDPTGTQETKPSLKQLRDVVKTKKKYKQKSPEINRNQGTMTDKQIKRMRQAGLL